MSSDEKGYYSLPSPIAAKREKSSKSHRFIAVAFSLVLLYLGVSWGNGSLGMGPGEPPRVSDADTSKPAARHLDSSEPEPQWGGARSTPA